MKISLKSLSLLSAISAGSAFALFSNGGFENTTEGFANWNLKYGTHSYALVSQGLRGAAAVDWSNVQSDQPVARIVTPTTDPADANPDAFYDPYVSVFNYPYEGTHKAQLNYHNWGTITNPVPGGDFHATQISQKGVVTAADAINGKYNLYVSWGAVMNDPNHPDGENPFFEISIKVNGVAVPGGYELHYSNAPSQNWQLIDNSPTVDPIYYTNNVFQYMGLKVGDEVEVILTVGDCDQSGHGVTAWIDYAGTTPPVVPPSTDTTKQISECLIARDALRLADNSKVDGDMISGGYGEIGAYARAEGNFSVKGTSFLRSFAWLQGNYTHESSEFAQDGATVLGISTLGPVTAPVLNTRILNPGSGWLEIRNNEDTSLAPGAFGDVTVRANSTLH